MHAFSCGWIPESSALACVVVITITLTRTNKVPRINSHALGFAGEEISEDHGDNGIDIRVASDLGGRFVVKQPRVCGVSDDGPGNDQIKERAKFRGKRSTDENCGALHEELR